MKILKEGILLEEKSILLEWGLPVIQLASRYNAIVEKRGIEYIAYWGEESLIVGSKINLYTKFDLKTPFNQISYSLDADSDVTSVFCTLVNYFNISIGQPYRINDNSGFSTSEYLWKINDVDIRLSKEDFKGMKLYLDISRSPSK